MEIIPPLSSRACLSSSQLSLSLLLNLEFLVVLLLEALFPPNRRPSFEGASVVREFFLLEDDDDDELEAGNF